MAIKVYNYTDDKYIEAADTRAELASIVGNSGVGFKGTIERNGTTDTYTVKAGSHAFINGLSVRFLTDESFDLTTFRYIAVETTYTAPDTYACTIVATSTVDSSLVGAVSKQVIIYDKQNGPVNHVFGLSEIRFNAQMKKITQDDGNVEMVLTETDDLLAKAGAYGKGLRTFYAPTGAAGLPPSGISVRGFIHFTNEDIGWIWAIDYKNNVWSNYYNGSVDRWAGWTELSSVEQKELWSGVTYLAGTTTDPHTITPTKPLSQCRNGWILIWSDYDPAPTDKVNDYNFVVSYIPKSFSKIFNAKGLYLHMITNISSDTGDMNTTGKYVYVHDDKLVGVPENSTAKWANDVVLRRVLEW